MSGVVWCGTVSGAEEKTVPQPPPLPLAPPGTANVQPSPGPRAPRPPAPKIRTAPNGQPGSGYAGSSQPLVPPFPLPPANSNSPRPPLAPYPAYTSPNPVTVTQLLPSNSLAWDSESKEYKAKLGDTNAVFTFWLTNVCDKEVLVNAVRTSCGCTAAKLPDMPWHLAPGSNGPIQVVMDLRAKRGKIVKSVTVDTTAGTKSLLVTSEIPVDPAFETQMNRSQNMQAAMTDRQVVFRGDCARCHVQPGVGKMGKELYTASCGICHEAEHRASMVTDLKTLKHPTDLAYWTHWIREGKPGTMMPAFASEHGGPLTAEQVASLAAWLTENYKGSAPVTGAAESVPTAPVQNKQP